LEGPRAMPISFSVCVTADDPEYKRPNLKPFPAVVVEDQRK
jgi:hypothetical protein